MIAAGEPCASEQFPHNQRERVHVDALEVLDGRRRLVGAAECATQTLGRHVAHAALLLLPHVVAIYYRLLLPVNAVNSTQRCAPVAHSRAEVGETAAATGRRLHQHVLGLEVAVRNARLVLDSHDLLMQVAQAARHAAQEGEQLTRVERVGEQEVVERAERMQVGDDHEHERGRRGAAAYVGRDVAEYVLVSQHARLVDVGLARPRRLVQRVEELHGHRLVLPAGAPHAAEAAVADRSARLVDVDVAPDGALHQFVRPAARRDRRLVIRKRLNVKSHCVLRVRLRRLDATEDASSSGQLPEPCLVFFFPTSAHTHE